MSGESGPPPAPPAEREHWPVVVVGGGPSGLAAAIELGHAGVRCLVLEPRTEVSDDRPRAKTTSARTMELLRRWGLADRVRAAAPVPVAVAEDVVFCTGLTGREITRFRHAFAMHADRCDEFAEGGQQVPQPVVERVLRSAVAELRSVTLRTGVRAEAVVDGPDGARVRVVDGAGTVTEVGADWVLGCDGSGGVSRAAIGATYAGSSGAMPNTNITFRAPALDEDRLCARAAHWWVVGSPVGGIVGRMDLEGTWWAIAQGVGPDSGADPADLVRTMIGPDVADADVEVLATDPWTARMLLVDHYRGHRVFLVGDAAHLNPPWGGHGYNTCVGDAVNLAWKLAAVLTGWAGQALLDSYEPERRPVAAQTIADAATQDGRLAAAFTVAGDDAALAEALQVKQAEFHSLGLVLGYHYAASPVVVDDGSPVPAHEPTRYHASARPGARLPHRWCADGSSLYDHLCGAGLTLLRLDRSLPVDPVVDAAQARGVPLAVVDTDPAHLRGDLARWGARLLLVRPDQHVAWRADRAPEDAEVVLDRVLGTSVRPLAGPALPTVTPAGSTAALAHHP